MGSDNLISVAAIVFNNQEIVQSFISDVISSLIEKYKYYELIIIDNGSTDLTVVKAKELMGKYKNIRLIVLSKRNDEEIAFTAALENCIGDFVVLMDVNHDPPQFVHSLVDLCSSGYDYVIAERKDRHDEPLIYRVFSWFFYRIMTLLTGQDIKTRWSNFICLNRKMVNSIIQIKDRVRYLKVLNQDIGYSGYQIAYERIQRGSKNSSRSFWNRIRFAVETIISSSDKLIRTTNLISLFISLLNGLYIFYALGIHLFKPSVAQGWTSTSIVMAAMFGAWFFIIAVLGEYLCVIFKEVKKGPLYHVAYEVSSSELFDQFDERNIA